MLFHAGGGDEMGETRPARSAGGGSPEGTGVSAALLRWTGTSCLLKENPRREMDALVTF